MAAPRRAIKQGGPSARVVVAVVIAALLALGGGAVWLFGSFRDGDTVSPAPGSAETAASAAQRAASSPAAAQQTLDDCRAQVGRVEEVIVAASTGIEHWRRHVQAQTDRFEGRITEDQMRAEFSETKLAGPDDVQRYDAAVAANNTGTKGCQSPQAVPAELAGQLNGCRRRSDMLGAGLAQADTTMNDWKKHLADMQHSASGQVPHAQDIWLETWRKAPPNLDAWAATQRSMAGAPTC